MIVRPSTASDIVHIVTTMRDLSAAEAFASRGTEDRSALAREIIAAADRALLVRTLAHDTGVPIALVGLAWTGPGRAGILFLATDSFPRIAAATHRWFCRRFMPETLAKFRRVEFTGSAPDTASGRWLASLGFFCEGVATAYGKHGEDFGHWAWINPHWKPTVDTAGGRVSSALPLDRRAMEAAPV